MYLSGCFNNIIENLKANLRIQVTSWGFSHKYLRENPDRMSGFYLLMKPLISYM